MKKMTSILMMFLAFTLCAEIRIYKGWSTSYSDCTATYRDGRLYKGWSTSYSDCVATYREGRLYKGWSTSYSDCIFSFSETPPPELIVWLMFSFYRGMFL